MKKTSVVFFVFIIAALASCKKIISVNLNNVSPKIVILGEVTNAAGPYHITINTTVNFSQTNNYPPVSGAKVIITDDKGLVDTLTETTQGNYSTHSFWQGQPGNTYTMNVILSGVDYKAVSTMPPAIMLDSIRFQQDSRGRNNNVIEAVAYFQDTPGISNYYQFTETINSKPLAKTLIFDDRFSDGRYIILPLFTDSSYMKQGDAVSLSMYCIDKNTFQYLNELQQLVDGNPFNQATPANPDSNISSGALGYFSAHTTQTKQAVVKL